MACEVSEGWWNGHMLHCAFAKSKSLSQDCLLTAAQGWTGLAHRDSSARESGLDEARLA